MSNIKIFRANRGEGKTKWLVEQAMNEYDAGKTCYHLGKYEDFANIWASVRHELCPIESRRTLTSMPIFTKPQDDMCFFVDEFFLNEAAFDVLIFSKMNDNATWYITMDQADFVN